MWVSIVIPAYNAADTIADTLQSILDQTYPHWEAIVVDDGSEDATELIVATFMKRDPRVRCIRQQRSGVSIARNNGIKMARFKWLLFLDADDWILSDHLARSLSKLESDPSLDSVYCGWAYVTPDNEYVFEQVNHGVGDLFVQHASYCFSVIHTYIVRRSLVEAVGGFDPSFRTCEDWDLWQRIARAGARFGRVPEVLSAYRMRVNSATSDGMRLLRDGLRVITYGHGPDPRLDTKHTVYPDGLPKERLARAKFALLCACAGFMIGAGKDAQPLLNEMGGEKCSNMNPHGVAVAIAIHAIVSACRPRSEWFRLWPSMEEHIREFLIRLEAESGTRQLARDALPLSRLFVMQHARDPGCVRRIRVLQMRIMLHIHDIALELRRTLQRLRRLMWVVLTDIPRVK